MLENTNNADAILAAGKALGTPIQVKGFRPYSIIPDGYAMEQLEEAPLLDYIQQGITVNDAASFVAYVKQFKTPTTLLFAAPVNLAAISAGSNGGASISAFLDYHGNQDPQRNQHVVQYPLPLSVEMQAWLASNDKPMKQDTFIKFLDLMIADIVSPPGAALHELTVNFESKSEVNFQSKVVRKNNTRTLAYQETTTSGATGPTGFIEAPEVLELAIPVFEGGELYGFTAKMCWDTTGGTLKISYVLQRPHIVFRKAIEDARASISKDLDLPILTGAPSVVPTK